VKIGVVGAGGFIGGRLVRSLCEQGHQVVPILRSARGLAGERLINDLNETDWANLLEDVDSVVHLAGRAHKLKDEAADPLAEFRRVNCLGTLRLAEEAARSGVRRFVFISSIGVNGERTTPGRPFRPDDTPNPNGPYALSKLEAEQGLRAIAEKTKMDVVIIRPPLIYGAGAKGRFRMLLEWLRKGRPLPLGLVRNRRQFAGIDNLTSFISACLTHPRAAGETFLVADAEAVSTARFVRLLAQALGRRALLAPIPVTLMQAAAALFNRKQAATGLLDSLEIDLAKNRQLLGWTPPLTLEQGLERAVVAPVDNP
jgi:nucleoside-diphosphate-sugar epimerase